VFRFKPVTDVVHILQEHAVVFADVTMLSSVKDV